METATQQTVLEAAKMLKEFQDQAMMNVKQILLVPKSNVFELSGFTWIANTMVNVAQRGEWNISFAINGKVYNLDGLYDQGQPRQDIVKRIMTEMEKQIQEIIAADIGDTMKQFLIGR